MGIIDLLRPAFGLIPEVQPAKVANISMKRIWDSDDSDQS
jgi:hypothetical protein